MRGLAHNFVRGFGWAYKWRGLQVYQGLISGVSFQGSYKWTGFYQGAYT